MALDVYFTGDIEAGLISTLFNGLCSSINSDGINVEYCKGLIAQSKAIAEMCKCDWMKIEGRVFLRLSDDELGILIENHIPLIGT